MNYNIFQNKTTLAKTLANSIADQINHSDKKKISLALSGGGTPQLFYEQLAKTDIEWEKINIFWSDERCVPPIDNESNFKMIQKKLLNHIDIPEKNIFRIRGEVAPETEVGIYAKKLHDNVSLKHDIPNFDIIFLGVGEDGHTASLFPNAESLSEQKKYATIATHPITGQTRISMTLPVLWHAKRLIFIVTGANKAVMMKKLIREKQRTSHYPASLVIDKHDNYTFWLDPAASRLL